MKTRGRRVAVGAAVAGLAVLIAACWVLRNPILETWYAYELHHAKPSEQWEVALSMEARGPAGRKVAADWYLAKLEDAALGARMGAAEELGRLRCARAVPLLTTELIDLVKAYTTRPARDGAAFDGQGDSSTGFWPGKALIRIGGPSVTHLMGKLKRSDASESEFIVRVLGGIGAPAVPQLARVVFDPDSEEYPMHVRVRVSNMFGSIRDKAGAAVGPAITALGHRSQTVRFHAAIVLEGIGPGAVKAVPRLIEALSDNLVVRWRVVHALKAIGPAASEAVPALVRVVAEPHDGSRRIREFKSTVFQTIAVVDPGCDSCLLQALQASDPAVRAHLVRSLAPLRSRVGSSTVFLKGLLNDPSEDLRLAASESLREIESSHALPR